MNSDQKSTEKFFTSVDKEGTSEDQKKKLNGVNKNANSDENAVSDTDSATLPFAQ
jgi:hypothetical protein